jgi:hypothetical protein
VSSIVGDERFPVVHKAADALASVQSTAARLRAMRDGRLLLVRTPALNYFDDKESKPIAFLLLPGYVSVQEHEAGAYCPRSASGPKRLPMSAISTGTTSLTV